MDLPFDPRKPRRSTVYLAGGRLRPLWEVLLRRHFERLQGKAVARRPPDRHGPWRPYYVTIIFRNGYQERRRSDVLAARRVIRRMRFQRVK